MIECNIEATIQVNTLDEVASIEDRVTSFSFEDVLYVKQKMLDDTIILTIILKNCSMDIVNNGYVELLAKAIQKPFEGKEKPKITICVKPLVHETWYTF